MPARVDQCPSCRGPLLVRELHCNRCDIQLRGSFTTGAPGPFARLSEDQLAFLRLFVTSRGNLSDIERTLGVSYPTVRAKLDDLIGAMQEPDEANAEQPGAAAVGATPADSTTPAAPALSRREILARIADGSMTSQEGFALIRQLPEEG